MPPCAIQGKTALKPDGVYVVSGDNVSVAPGVNAPIKFGVTCQGQNVGYLGGYAQERIQNVTDVQNNNKTLLVDSGWQLSKFGTPNSRFAVSGNGILDIKRYSAGSAAWAARSTGVIVTANQSLQIVFKDPCGNMIYCPLTPSFTVSTVKDANGTTYHYEHK